MDEQRGYRYLGSLFWHLKQKKMVLGITKTINGWKTIEESIKEVRHGSEVIDSNARVAILVFNQPTTTKRKSEIA